MCLSENFPKYAVRTGVAVGAGIALWQAFGPGSGSRGQAVAVSVPALSPQASDGQVAFDANCAACHGASAAGSDRGPPLVHDIYNPGHHGDNAFFVAAQRGVPAHHWRFGNMPPQPQVSDSEIQAIVQYVRELQLANGISWKPHAM